MSGLLDPKSRVMDVVLTDVGRQALAAGEFEVVYYSLSDASVFYEADVASGSADMTSRVYLECSNNLPQDVISPSPDASGQLTKFASPAMSGSLFGGRILSGTYSGGTSLSGSRFASSAGSVLSSSLYNFRNNFVLGTVDDFFDEDVFGVSPGAVRFTIDQGGAGVAAPTVSVNALENMLQDSLFSHLANFAYLPPVNKPSDPEQAPSSLGAYRSFGGSVELTFDDVVRSIALSRAAGRTKTVTFDPAPRDNNVHLQFFEQTSVGMHKLHVVDFGTYRDPDSNAPVRTLFVGKLYENDYGAETFVRIFTVTLS